MCKGRLMDYVQQFRSKKEFYKYVKFKMQKQIAKKNAINKLQNGA